tara:strand:+ start:3194 stop:3724 length:531 start_codon:yes stop_codon:yes gene_type:complete
MIIKNIKLKNKHMILKTLQTIAYVKHDLVEEGGSTYNYKLGSKINNFKNIINNFKKLAGTKYYVLDFWSNVYKKNGYVKKHNHHDPNSNLKDTKQLSGVYYFQHPDDSNLIIEEKNIPVKEDDFILFDSKLNHYTLPNKSEKEKIVFSINLAHKEKQCLENQLYKKQLKLLKINLS